MPREEEIWEKPCRLCGFWTCECPVYRMAEGGLTERMQRTKRLRHGSVRVKAWRTPNEDGAAREIISVGMFEGAIYVCKDLSFSEPARYQPPVTYVKLLWEN